MTGPRQIQNLALIGFMGVGKSSVGRLSAAQLQFRFVDTDDLIETRTGKTISNIFDSAGEAGFREIERQVVAELQNHQKTVIATGGGLAASETNLASLKQHALVVCLWASAESIWQRVKDQDHRPLLREADPFEKIRQLLAAREPFYRQADVLINTERRPIREVTQHVLHQFLLARSQPNPH